MKPQRRFVASMRPGPIRPGDASWTGWRSRIRLRFNEARADSPGRYEDLEAYSGDVFLGASMRPGPIRPGDILAFELQDLDTRRFNEARADSPGRSEKFEVKFGIRHVLQ